MESLKVLKITKHSGTKKENISYVPFNKVNVNFHKEFKSSLSEEKREKYLVEEVVLSVEEAAELGFSEAIQVLNPHKASNTKKETSNINELLMKQNQELMERLAVLESKTETKKK
jgi:hypothetical protein